LSLYYLPTNKVASVFVSLFMYNAVWQAVIQRSF